MGKYKSKRQQKLIHRRIFAIVGGTIAATMIVAILAGIVYGDNQRTCGEAGLGASVLGCVTIPEYNRSNITFVVGNTANSPRPIIDLKSTSPNAIKKYLANSSDINNITIFSTASNKTVTYSWSLDKSDNNNIANNLNEEYRVLNEKLSATPEYNGSNYLDTIITAVKHANAQTLSHDKALVAVIGSGLSDNGTLNFADNHYLDGNGGCLQTDIRALESDLKPVLDNLPQIAPANNTTVIWYGLGQTQSPQSTLTPSQQDNLKTIYKIIFEKLGIPIIFDDTILPNDNDAIQTEHTVKPTHIPDSFSVTFNETGNVSFLSDSSDFIDASLAKQEISNTIPLCQDTKIQIEGYVALEKCNASANTDLAQQRADAVKNLIQQILSDTNKTVAEINAVGVGHGPHDECSSGYYDKDIAQQNRYVLIRSL